MLEAHPQPQPLTSLSTKIIFFVFLSTFLTALVISWVSIQSTHAYLRQQINQAFPSLAERSAEQILRWSGQAAEPLEALAMDPGLARALAGIGEHQGGAAPEALRALLESRLATAPSLDALVASGPDGAWRVEAGPGPQLDRELDLAAALGAEQPFAVTAGRRDGPAALVAVRRVVDARGRTVGFLAGRLRRPALDALLRSVRDERGAQVYLLRPDGAILAGAPVAGPADHPAPGGGLPSQPWPGVREYTSIGGSHVLGSVRHLDGVDAWAVVEAPFEAAFAPVLSVVTRIFAIDLCIIVLFSFVAYRITTAIVRPIEALSAAARLISQGRVDHEIPDPQSGDEIGLLTRAFNDMIVKLRRNHEQIEAANEQLTEQNEELQRANEVLAQLSITDGLTKLHNHRFFQDHLTREIKRARRTGEPLSMLLCDLDDFKALNDRLGHAAGDELLERVARIMEGSIRDSDLLARYGGEEFVVLASNTDVPGAVKLAEKIRRGIEDASHLLDDTFSLTRVTVSIGVALYKGDRKRFFLAADQALYRAKELGKNRVIAADA
jgi:diguanylate cyclase (GGDEF)-like protein